MIEPKTRVERRRTSQSVVHHGWQLLAAAALTALAAGMAITFTVTADRPRLNVDAVALLEAARQESPFSIRVPTKLPVGFALTNVIYGGSDDPADETFYVDLYFENDVGARLHVWQTNNRLPTVEDPLQDSRSVSVDLGDSVAWRRTELAGGGRTLFVLATRYEDGVTLTLDLRDDYATLTQAAQSLR